MAWLLQYVFPKPCPQEYIESIHTWQDTPEVRSKEEVMMEEFGEAVKPDGSTSGAVSMLLYPYHDC